MNFKSSYLFPFGIWLSYKKISIKCLFFKIILKYNVQSLWFSHFSNCMFFHRHKTITEDQFYGILDTYSPIISFFYYYFGGIFYLLCIKYKIYTLSRTTKTLMPILIYDNVTENPSESMVITWSTVNSTPLAYVLYGTGSATEKGVGKTKKFVDSGEEARSQYIHRVKLSGLQPAKRYGN